MRLAVLDLGSNTFHLLVANVDPSGSITKIGSYKRTLALGAEVPAGGTIGERAWERAMAAIAEILGLARPFACPTLAVATSVFRDAVNGRAFVEAARSRFDIPIDLLSGAEEARLGHLGAISEVPGARPVSVIDVGGGSIQFTVGDDDGCRLATSLPFGVLRLRRTAEAATSDGRTAAAVIAEALRRHAGEVARDVTALHPQSLVLASGTARALASLPLLDAFEQRPPPRRADSPGAPPMATRVTRTAVKELGTALMGLDAAALRRLGVPADRHATIGPGAIALGTLMELCGFEHATIATRALREGVIMRALAVARAARRAPASDATSP